MIVENKPHRGSAWPARRRRNLAVWLLLTALAGCDLAPRYHVPLTAVPARYKEAAAFQPAMPADGLKRGDCGACSRTPCSTASKRR